MVVDLKTSSLALLLFCHNYFVLPFSRPQRYQNIIVTTSNAVAEDEDTRTSSLEFAFKIVDRCAVNSLLADTHIAAARDDCYTGGGLGSLDMVSILQKWNPNGLFPSRSQAKRSLNYGKVLSFSSQLVKDLEWCEAISNSNSSSLLREDIFMSLETLQSYIARNSSTVDPDSVLVVVDQIPSSFRYPPAVTKYMFPPLETINMVPIVYEDDQIAVVNKPENMTTIGHTGINNEKRDAQTNDLQSVLSFLLSPSPSDPNYQPRPIHRLDRRTSGLVVVAKTKDAMRSLSKAFANRLVSKTYTALVFERNKTLSRRLDSYNQSETTKWLTIDHPIDDRESISKIRKIETSIASHLKSSETADGNVIETQTRERISLVQIRPKTGRTHQIRRHLSYCLGMPIIGDSKYDGGAKHLRKNGMFLCCHALRFPYRGNVNENYTSTVQRKASIEWIHGDLSLHIPLPEKFTEWT